VERGLETWWGRAPAAFGRAGAAGPRRPRMFVRQPELLVFRLTSSALDVETEQALWERLGARLDLQANR